MVNVTVVVVVVMCMIGDDIVVVWCVDMHDVFQLNLT